MDKELQNLLGNYFDPGTEELSVNEMFRMVEQVMDELPMLFEQQGAVPVEEDPGAEEDLQIFIPRIRISEKMWGQQGSEDRQIIQSLLTKMVGEAGGTTLKEKVERISAFLEERPKTEDISEILTHIVLLDTLTNIMLHFNASAAGFTFEGFLSALLSGTQIPAGSAGIQDLIDADDNPISLKLLGGEGPKGSTGAVHGSYSDLINHFIDPISSKEASAHTRRSEKHLMTAPDPETGERQVRIDPETNEPMVNPHYVGQAGALGTMTYVVVLKSFKDAGSTGRLSRQKADPKRLEGKAETIRFFQFDWTANTFFEAMASSKHNAKLLLLPKEEFGQTEGQPEEGTQPQPEQEVFDPISPEDQKRMVAGRKSGKDPGTAYAYRRIINDYVPEYAKELLDGATLRPTERNPRKLELVDDDGELVKYAVLPTGDPRRKDVASVAHTQTIEGPRGDIDPETGKRRVTKVEWLDYGTSVKILKQALPPAAKPGTAPEAPTRFWELIAKTSGATGAADETQFVVAPSYYRNKKWEDDGFGYIGQITVGKQAIYELAEAYSDILNQKIYDMFKKVQTLSQQINGYFIGGKKNSALDAAKTADEIEHGAREYHEQDVEKQQAMAAKE